MKTYFIYSLSVVGVCCALLIAGGWYALNRTHISFSERLAYEQTRIVYLEQELARISADANALRGELESQEVIRAQETEDIRQSLDASVSQLASAVGTQNTTLQTLSNAADVSGLIDRWSPLVYEITCSFKTSERGTLEARGSATLMQYKGSTVFATNAHVVEKDGATLVGCDLLRPDDAQAFRVLGADIESIKDVDIAYGRVSVDRPSIAPADVCSTPPRIGERIITLGYPRIGAEDSITVTEGIISGFDNSYYATSAKIERGNSGGAAVSIERGCFLGWPTLVIAGRIEALARILPASSL